MLHTTHPAWGPAPTPWERDTASMITCLHNLTLTAAFFALFFETVPGSKSSWFAYIYLAGLSGDSPRNFLQGVPVSLHGAVEISMANALSSA